MLKRFTTYLGEVKTFIDSKGLICLKLEQPKRQKNLSIVDMKVNLTVLNTAL